MDQTEVIKIPWEKSIWFFDIDDTLIDTGVESIKASEGIRQVIASHFGEKEALEMQQEFIEIFQLMLFGYQISDEAKWETSKYDRQEFDSLIEQIEKYQKEIKISFGAVKKWSREVFVKIAADHVGLRVTAEIIHQAADGYWMYLAQNTRPFEQATQLFREINQHQRPIFLLSSSDARLKMQDNGQFRYIPEYSEGLKRERIELLRHKGLKYNLVSIGDPEDKPSVEFFNKAIKLAEDEIGEKLNLEDAIIVGDSYQSDLATPREQLGFGLAVLYEKGRTELKLEGRGFVVTGNLIEVTSFLS